MNEIVNEENNMNGEIFGNYFNYQFPSSLVEDLFKADESEN